MSFSLRSNSSNKNKKNVSKVKKTINAITTTIIVAVFVVALAAMFYLLVQVFRGKSPSLFGYRFYFVLTESMTPTLEPKDMILSKLIEDNTDVEYVKSMVKEGDIVTYLGKIGSQDAYITHRVIRNASKDDVIYYDEERGSWMVITKGDNNSAADAPIPISKITAVMVKKVNIISSIYNFSTKTVGGLCLLGIPMVFILGSLIYRMITVIKTPEEEIRKKDGYADLTDAEKKKLEEDIAIKAVEEYKALELRKQEIANKAVEEYKAKHSDVNKNE